MKTKKTDRSNLENKRFLFFETGLVIVLMLSLVAFEWKTTSVKSSLVAGINLRDAVEQDMITTYRPKKKKIEVIVQKPKDINIVDDLKKIDSDLDNFNSEIQPNEGIDIFIPKDTDESPVSTDFVAVEEMPRFNGGDINTFVKYVYENIRYPVEAENMGIEGNVLVQFVVDQQGHIVDVKVLNKTDPLLSNEVLRVLNESESWTPGKQNGKAVRVRFIIPIKFRLP